MTLTAEGPSAPEGSPGLYRLLAWLSPGFPIGGFSYSHGLEAAVAGGAVRDRVSLETWIVAVVTQGSGRMDADILRDSYRAACAGNRTALDAANRRGTAFRATAELALEAGQQGEAFLATCRAAWPEPFIEAWPADRVCHSAVFGAVAARAGIAPADGQRILAALEPAIGRAAAAAMTRDPSDFGAATFAVDLASTTHETQYTRLFRS
jgi:urease accessory protein